MAKYTSKRTSYNSTNPSARKKVHQTTVVFDQDTIAFLKQQSRKNADFNRRVAALDRIYDDSSTNSQQTFSRLLNNYRIKTDAYVRRKTNNSSGKSSSIINKSVQSNQRHRNTSQELSRSTNSNQTKSRRNTTRKNGNDYLEDTYNRTSKSSTMFSK